MLDAVPADSTTKKQTWNSDRCQTPSNYSSVRELEVVEHVTPSRSGSDAHCLLVLGKFERVQVGA